MKSKTTIAFFIGLWMPTNLAYSQGMCIPPALKIIQLMKNAGLVTQSITQMRSGTATELRFAPNATEFVTKFFNPAQ